jgi:putative two-component system response regulator
VSGLDELSLRAGRVLVVDDQPANVELLIAILRQGGFERVEWTYDPRVALGLFNSFGPDVVLLDLHMPHLDGFELMERFEKIAPGGVAVPVIILTADIDPRVKQRALEAGAGDFLIKPFDTTEVLLRLRNQLETRFLQLSLQRQNLALEERVRLRTGELLEARLEILERLALAAEFRDKATLAHTRRVGHVAALTSETLGFDGEFVEIMRLAAPLHDVGKIAIPDEILLKEGPLSEEEFETIKLHTTAGARLLSGSHFDVTRSAEKIALTHHDRWDGTGYPAGLSAEDIPIAGRIVAVADVFDALTHERPYKAAWPVEEALIEIESQAGRQFDPAVVEAFLDLSDRGALALVGAAGEGADINAAWDSASL